MSKRPYASDWILINDDGVVYSKELDRYYYRGNQYDERSARHNGIIGLGATLRTLIKENNDARKMYI